MYTEHATMLMQAPELWNSENKEVYLEMFMVSMKLNWTAKLGKAVASRDVPLFILYQKTKYGWVGTQKTKWRLRITLTS